jgi:hypothetical protein
VKRSEGDWKGIRKQSQKESGKEEENEVGK